MSYSIYLSYDIEITLKTHFWRKNVIILSICKQRCYGRHNVLNICKPPVVYRFLQGVISVPDATSYHKFFLKQG